MSVNYNYAQLALQQWTTETTIPGTQPASTALKQTLGCDSTHFLYSQSIKNAILAAFHMFVLKHTDKYSSENTTQNEVRRCHCWYVIMFESRGEGLIWSRVVMLFSKFLYLNTQTQRLLLHRWGPACGCHWLITVNVTFRLPLSASAFLIKTTETSQLIKVCLFAIFHMESLLNI